MDPALGDLIDLLVCPRCRGELTWQDADATCSACGETYPGADGVPVLLPPEARTPYKEEQATSHDDHEAPEFEITRPAGTPQFYARLMLDKYRRSMLGLTTNGAGATAVTVCGGAGMDAEFLARDGYRVIATDISAGACARTLERARRSSLPIIAVVADAERLPLRDGAVTLSYVHDGLHHLEDPLTGVAEMARVARSAVSITEPAGAAATRLAVRVGVSDDVEESGNVVHRLQPEEYAAALAEHGFEAPAAHRYAMYYRHFPGRVTRFLSRRRVAPVADWALRTANRTAGGIGNKLAVPARRAD